MRALLLPLILPLSPQAGQGNGTVTALALLPVSGEKVPAGG
ncbi:hypothetical protein PDO_2077 [Rhizobium sp. PDO1-076]|nr:hypothetical protein PDO_2077 [Rhizobium sp. PDO1-076]